MKTNRCSAAFIRALTERTDAERVITDPERLSSYARDESSEEPHQPDVVVQPVSTDEVAAVVRLCAGAGVPVTPRGLGTGLTGGSVPLAGGVVLSLELMNRVLAVSAADMVVRTQPGVTTGRVAAACAEAGLYYPVDPASLDDCSIGGNVAENAGGARAFRYGVTGDWLRGVEAVLADGSVIRHGGSIHKNTVGYDLARLLVGSEGTIAVITELVLKVIPRPRRTVDLLVPFERMSQGLELVARVLADERITPACVEFIERKGIRACNQVLKSSLPFPDAEVQLLIELDGNELERVNADAVAIGELALKLGAREPLVAGDATDQARIWQARRELHNVLKAVWAGLATEDIVVPLSAIPDTVDYLERLEKKTGLPIVPWGHIGDGNIHVGFCQDSSLDRAGFLAAKRAAVAELAEFILARGGQIAAEHGIGSTRKWLMPRAVGANELALMRRLKAALDPDNILNPGKILP